MKNVKNSTSLRLRILDLEYQWDANLRDQHVIISDHQDDRYRIAHKRVAAAAVLDITVGPDGEIGCTSLNYWTLATHGSEQGVVEALFMHLYGAPDAVVVTYGGTAVDVPILNLAALEFGLPLPRQLIDKRPIPEHPHLLRHHDLGLALKGRGKTWSHATEVLTRMGIPITLLAGKAQVHVPPSAVGYEDGWRAVTNRVVLDVLLEGIMAIVWMRTAGYGGIDPACAKIAVAEWALRHHDFGRFLERGLQVLIQQQQALIAQRGHDRAA